MKAEHGDEQQPFRIPHSPFRISMIDTVLIANRGEIACRIMRSCRDLGIRTVTVYSTADAHSRHVREADEAIWIGEANPAESYLNHQKLISAALRVGAQAIHPGYGFVAENADFVRACGAAGLIFIGPTAEAMAAMGNKQAAKAIATAAGVPTVPGYGGADQSDEAFTAAAETIGYPLLVKAADGGGGKGMRLVHTAADLPPALATARREAQQAFGSAELLLERAILRPRHIEIQLLGDQYGHLIHLGERDCSLQRRHQKVVEEAPAVGISGELRAQLGEAAVAVGKAVGYHSAGTVEFLLDEAGHFYFLEMNTRIQVEHPVTEMVTGLDLVAWQIRLAEGERLTIQQEDVRLDGHAIEVRLYAENPAHDFLPVTGEVLLWREPSPSEGVRVESGLLPRDQITIHYDPMVAKLVAYGADRPTAVRRLRRALQETHLLGLVSNQFFLQDVLAHEAFRAGNVHTGFLAEHLGEWQQPVGDVSLALIAATMAQVQAQSPAPSGGHWRNSPNRPLRFRYANNPEVWLTPQTSQVWQTYEVSLVDGQTAQVLKTCAVSWVGDGWLVVDGWRQQVVVAQDGDVWWVQTASALHQLHAQSLLPAPKASAEAGGSLRAPMPGVVTAVLVAVGEQVVAGQPLLKLEAMKMEHTIRSAADGVVEAIFYQRGEQVEAAVQLLRVS